MLGTLLDLVVVSVSVLSVAGSAYLVHRLTRAQATTGVSPVKAPIRDDERDPRLPA